MLLQMARVYSFYWLNNVSVYVYVHMYIPAVERVVYSLGSRQSAAVCLPPAAALSHMGLGKGKALLHSACWFLSSTPLLPHTCP